MINVSTVRRTVLLVWYEASRFVKIRLAVAVLLLMTASVLTALGPIALKHVIVSRVNLDERLASIKLRRDHAASGSCCS